MSALPAVPTDASEAVPERTRTLFLAIRQALIICIGAIETYLGMERSIVPRRKRE